jgi:hypothetical protein
MPPKKREIKQAEKQIPAQPLRRSGRNIKKVVDYKEKPDDPKEWLISSSSEESSSSESEEHIESSIK